MTTANPVEQILGVEAEGIKINFDYSKYFCLGGGGGGDEGGKGLYLLELFSIIDVHTPDYQFFSLPQNKHFWWCITDRALLLSLNLLSQFLRQNLLFNNPCHAFHIVHLPSSSCLSLSPRFPPTLSTAAPKMWDFLAVPLTSSSFSSSSQAGHEDSGKSDPPVFVTHISGPALPKSDSLQPAGEAHAAAPSKSCPD